MPLIRIDVPEGISKDIKKQIHSKVREVVLKTLAPKEVKYDYVFISHKNHNYKFSNLC